MTMVEARETMAGAAGTPVAAPRVSLATPRDFFDLLKPRVMSLVVFTALVGLLQAPGEIHPLLAVIAIMAIAIGAGASGALNMWYDADIDARMGRTRLRPVPSGRVSREEACAFGAILSVFSVMMLGIFVDWTAAALLALTIVFYVGVYTIWLKRRTTQNIVIGGAAGAFPPLIGWAAVTGEVAFEPLVMVLIIFLWTPPHFWALALLKSDDYARAGVPMLPVIAGDRETRRQILIYTAILFPAGLLPTALGYAGLFYGAIAVALGAFFILRAVELLRAPEGEAARKAAGRLFGFSIVYLFALFSALLVEAVVPGLS